jgi:hypothetical protein
MINEPDPGLSNSIIGYTTNTLLDSDQHTGFPVIPTEGKTPNDSTLQLFRCSRALVDQYGTLDTETGRIIPSTLHPNLQKNHSMWQMWNSTSDGTDSSSALLEGDSVSYYPK